MQDPLKRPETGAGDPTAGDEPGSGRQQDPQVRSEGPEGEAQSDPDDQEVTVSWGDSQKRMKLSELTQLARTAEESKQAVEAARRLIREDAQLDQLRNWLEGLNENQQQVLASALQNPSILSQQGQRQSEQPRQPNGQQDHGGDDRISRIEQALTVLLQREQGREQEVQQKRQTDAVEAAIKPYERDVLVNPSAKKMVRRTVLLELASNPEAKVDDVVAQVVTEYHKAVQEQMRGAARPPRGPVQRTPEGERQKPNLKNPGDALQSGAIRDMVARQLGLR